jgi:hypothetical protein
MQCAMDFSMRLSSNAQGGLRNECVALEKVLMRKNLIQLAQFVCSEAA